MFLNPKSTEKEKIAGLLGLHVKFWHAPLAEMKRMMYRVGHGKDILALITKALLSCKECRDLAPTLHKPLVGEFRLICFSYGTIILM